MLQWPVYVNLNMTARKQSHVGLQLSLAAERYAQDRLCVAFT